MEEENVFEGFAMQALLVNDGVDELGGWLQSMKAEAMKEPNILSSKMEEMKTRTVGAKDRGGVEMEEDADPLEDEETMVPRGKTNDPFMEEEAAHIVEEKNSVPVTEEEKVFALAMEE